MTEPTFEQMASLAKKKLICYGNEIKSINDTGRKGKTDEVSFNTFRGMMQTIDQTYSRVLSAWEGLLQLYCVHDKEADFPTESEKNTYAYVKRYYYEAHATYQETLKSVAAPQGAAGPSDPDPPRETSLLNASQVPGSFRARFPKINLPKFAGNLPDWPLFRDTFLSLIHTDNTINDMDKYHYLIGSLQGQALSAIRSIPQLESNYKLAWQALMKKFDHKRTLSSSYINTLLCFKRMTGNDTVEGLRHFLGTVPQNIVAFQNLNIEKPEEFILFELAIRCLDSKTREAFEIQNAKVDYPTFSSLVEFVEERYHALSMTSEDHMGMKEPSRPKGEVKPAASPNRFTPKQREVSPGGRVVLLANDPKGNMTPSCKLCGKGHRIADCPLYMKASIAERYSLLQKHRCCFNCLRSGQHSSHECKSSYSCRLCQRRHHTTLHRTKQETENHSNREVNPSTSSNPKGEKSVVAVCHDTSTTPMSILLGTAMGKIKSAAGTYEPVRLILDSGSQHCLLTKACVERLGLEPTECHHSLSGVGQVTLDENLGKVNCLIKTRSSSQPVLHTEALVVSTITGNLPQTVIPVLTWKKYINYDLADPKFWIPGPVDLLLGADLFADVVTSAPIATSPNEPKLLNSIFGYIVLGRYFSSPSQTSTALLNLQHEDVNFNLKRFWEVEEPESKRAVSPDDEFCEHHFMQTHYRQEDGRYVASLPLNEKHLSLGPSKASALKRLIRLEDNLKQNPDLKLPYDAFLKEYEDLDHMKETSFPGTFYLPHHAVRKAEESTGKIRVVFDASAKTNPGIGMAKLSLNDCLYSGPKLQLDISDLLLNFRRHRIVFTADIKKMYRQILINPTDRKYQHILWRAQPMQEVQEYELRTLTYGMSCAPFIALRVIQQLIADEGSAYPLAAQALKSDIYIDDVVTGADSFETALLLIKQLQVLLKKGGFELGKWTSNVPTLLEAASVSETDNLINLSLSDEPIVKILGLQWNALSDAFTYKVVEPPRHMTKRGILSTIARLFDPLGFVAPVTFTAKKILQDVWISGRDWDEKVPMPISQSWAAFVNELTLLSDVAIPRFLNFHPSATYTIAGFADASERGYCAAIYLQVNKEGQLNVSLLKAKTKLAPLKPTQSIPRLELCAAILLSTLYCNLKSFIEQLGQPKVYLFTDSTTVLSWLKTPSYLLKTYVSHRVNEVLEKTDPLLWHHVKSKDNPADLGSRGLMPAQIIQHNLWWKGPTWMAQMPQEWPLVPSPLVPTKNLPEVRPNSLTCVTVENPPDELETWIKRFSSYRKMIRSLAYVLRFMSNAKGRPEDRIIGPITSSEFSNANMSCIRHLQRHYYSNPNDMRSQLFKSLNVFKDESGIYRVGGRLRHSDLRYGEKHPILLPRRCPFNNLLIDYLHLCNLHLGNQALRSILQRKYWIPSGNDLIKQRARLCVSCFKTNAKPRAPYMGDLPVSRFSQSVFQHVGVDFAGPLLCRSARIRKSSITKAYVCIFICFTTKAVHIEIAHQLSTEVFLDCLERFMARRGVPAQIFSDCGTNFLGAAHYLKDVDDWFRSHETQGAVVEFATPKGIKWSFNPPRAPHFGGLWEAGVKSVKTLLYRTLGNQPFTERELQTLCIKIEGILNSRPITPISSDPNDLQPLTPGHFIAGKPLVAYPEHDFTVQNEHRLSRWQFLRRRTQEFWHRWKTEYLQTLLPRKKWIETQPNVSVGDLVLICDVDSPSLQWPLARVVELHPGRDNIVRVATIKTSKGLYKRPVVKLIPLPTQNPSPGQEK